MVDDPDNNPGPDWLRNLPVRSEEIGFSPDQMIACEGCGKSNPPNRAVCLYCAAELSGVGIAKSQIGVPDDWENGFNVVVVEADGAEIDRASVYVSSLFGTKRETVAEILTVGKALPLCRVETENQAGLISERLSEFGIRTRVIPDDSLTPASLPTRLKSIGFDGQQLKLELFGGGDDRTLERQDLVLIIPGVIREERIESVERRKLFAKKTLSETQTSFDKPVIDIYSRSDPAGWRVPASGFDFSCLGTEKSLLVSENMKRLILKLVEFAPSAKLVDDYAQVSSILESSWPSGTSQDKQVGRRRKDVSNVVTKNNTSQLTRYSRLQWRLYEKEI